MLNRRELLELLLSGALAPKDYPVRKPRVEALWRSPDAYPNALEATERGLWVGEQLTNTAYLLDWETGRVLRKVPTESTNTSGMAFGNGLLWMAANGPALRREPRPSDSKTGMVLKVDPHTGETLARYPIPGGGGVHGLTWGWKLTLDHLPESKELDPGRCRFQGASQHSRDPGTSPRAGLGLGYDLVHVL